MKHLIALLAVLMTSPASAAFKPICSENAVTNEMMCFQESEVRENGGIRTAPLYLGGPKLVERTRYTIAVNCRTDVIHLKDEKGVSFAGAGQGGGTKHSRNLLTLVCLVPQGSIKRK